MFALIFIYDNKYLTTVEDKFDLVLRIASALDVPVENLVTVKNPSSKTEPKNEDLHIYHKYAKTIESLDALPDSA